MPIAALLKLLLQFAGVSLIVLALSHVVLPRLLNWKEDLAKLSAINMQVFIVHCVFLVVGIFLLGLVCLVFPDTLLLKSQLALIGSACFFMCWLSRLLCGFFVFTADITTDRKIDACMRAGGTLLWVYYTVVFGMLLAYQCGQLGG